LKAQIFSHEKLIGTTKLQVGDESMGHVYGEFFPTEIYYNDIQQAVWEFWVSNKPDYSKWDSFKWNVQLDNGCFISAMGGFEFGDFQEFPDEPKRIDIAGIDRYIIQDFILLEEPKPFVEEPWGAISIEQKKSFEEELQKELGTEINKKSFFNLFGKANHDKHVLSDFEMMALCRDQRSDDVLFRINKQGFDKQFAMVHLTWRGYKEDEGYPKVQLYKDYDDFKYSRMYPDKADWEH